MMKDYNEKLKTKESKESKDAKPEVKAAADGRSQVSYRRVGTPCPRVTFAMCRRPVARGFHGWTAAGFI
jgi:hypothetical protein